MQRQRPMRPLVEIAAMAALLSSYIWWWGNSFQGGFLLCFILYLGLGMAAHIRAGERPADLGLRLDTLPSAGRDALLATILISFVLVGAGALLGSLQFPALKLWLKDLGDGVIWGSLQQYGLLAIFYRRFCELLPSRHGPMLATSTVFAFFHLPNPFMFLATFAAGALSCWLYRRSPNLFVLGAMHGVVSFLIVATLPDSVTMGMRVGPGYFNFVPGQ